MNHVVVLVVVGVGVAAGGGGGVVWVFIGLNNTSCNARHYRRPGAAERFGSMSMQLMQDLCTCSQSVTEGANDFIGFDCIQ